MSQKASEGPVVLRLTEDKRPAELFRGEPAVTKNLVPATHGNIPLLRSQQLRDSNICHHLYMERDAEVTWLGQ